MMQIKLKIAALAAGALFAVAGAASATTSTHSASDFTGAVTPAFGALADTVGDFFASAGVDYTYGNVEGVFNDGVLAFCGINAAGNCDLETDVDAQIVDTTTGLQSLTNFVSVEAGFASEGALTLSVFDMGMSLITTATNSAPLGPNGRRTMTIDRGAVSDIAYFSISGADTYGVNTVTIGDPNAVAPVPLPAAGWMLLAGLGGMAAMRRRKGADA